MKAVEFIKQFGWDYAKHVVKDPLDYSHYLGDTPYVDLKRYVNAYELVESYGGLESAKKFVGSEYRKLSQPKTYNRLCEAISDVENCDERS